MVIERPASPASSVGPIVVVVGTRPEAVKLAPVILALRAQHAREVIVCSSGQHSDLLDDALGAFGIAPDVALDTMTAGQSLLELQSRLFAAFHGLFQRVTPGMLVLQGDTSTVATASWAGFLKRIPVAHVEAGLRSGDRFHPFPEEVNRRLTSLVADVHFAPTPLAARNLLGEGIEPERVFVTGNTVVDALLRLRATVADDPPPFAVDESRPVVLVTVHRRENHGAPLASICAAVARIAASRPDVQIFIPVHPNPEVRATVQSRLGSFENCVLLPPLGYRSFVWLMLRSTVILTDSGGIQEEAPCVGVPALVMRNVTERPEGVDRGAVKLVGTDEDTIVSSTLELLELGSLYRQMAVPRWIYGDGEASARIVEVLLTGAMKRAPFAMTW